MCESAAEEEEGGVGGVGSERGGGGGGVQDTFHTLVQQQLPPVLVVAREGGREGGPGIRLYNFPLRVGAAGWSWMEVLPGRPAASSLLTSWLPNHRHAATSTRSAQQLVTITTCASTQTLSSNCFR